MLPADSSSRSLLAVCHHQFNRVYSQWDTDDTNTALNKLWTLTVYSQWAAAERSCWLANCFSVFKYVCVTEHRNSISPDVTVSHSLATSKGVCHHRKEVSSGCRVSDDVRGNRGRGSLTHTVISRSDAVMFSPELHQSSPNSSSPPVSILFVSQSCLDRCRGLKFIHESWVWPIRPPRPVTKWTLLSFCGLSCWLVCFSALCLSSSVWQRPSSDISVPHDE